MASQFGNFTLDRGAGASCFAQGVRLPLKTEGLLSDF